MKKTRKLPAAIFGLLLALLLLALPVFRAVPAYAADTGTITVTPPGDATAETTRTYSLYKVFVGTANGTNISYKTVNSGDVITDGSGNILLHSKSYGLPDIAAQVGNSYSDTTTPHFIIDTSGNVHFGTLKDGATATTVVDNNQTYYTYNSSDITDHSNTTLTEAAIAAIKEYVKGDSPIATVTVTGNTNAVFNGVAAGYYYITTSTGSVVSVDSARPSVTVGDKNNVPKLTKVISSVSAGSIDADGDEAIAQSGATVTYTVTVEFGNGSQNVKLHDALDSTLSLTGTPTVALQNSSGNAVASAGTSLYTIQTTPDTGDTLTISFVDGINNTAAKAVVTYTATVNSDTLSQTPAKNAAYVSYGSVYDTTTNAVSGTKTVTTSVYNGKITVTKVDHNQNPLAGAGFLLVNTSSAVDSNPNDEIYYYYKQDTTTKAVSWVRVEPTAGQTAENAARAALARGDITEYTTTAGSGGNVLTFTGLPDGSYMLMELDVPDGYNRATSSTFTINSATTANAFEHSNLEKTVTVTNTAGNPLPSTGGIGTTIFYIIGGVLIAGAVVLLIIRRKRT